MTVVASVLENPKGDVLLVHLDGPVEHAVIVVGGRAEQPGDVAVALA